MRITKYLLAVLVLSTAGCSRDNEPQMATSPAVAIGFNQNWSFLPQLTPILLNNIKQLKPEIIRYPGGTITHSWDWETGIKIGSNTIDKHPVTDIKILADAANCKFIFVLDILNKTFDDQKSMLLAIQKLGIPINYIELGNELYGQDASYVAAFPTGKEYGQKAALWANQLKQQFPNAKIAALLQARNATASNQRLNQWNKLTIDETYASIDAYTYHVYIPDGGSYLSRKEEFESVVKNSSTKEKELWITEYGNQNANSSVNYLKSLDSLADYLETFPKVTLVLNHLIVGNEKNKITADGSTFTPEGELYLQRAKKR